MTWHTLDGNPLMGERLRKLREEIAARNAEAKANPPRPKWDADTPLIVSPRLKPFIDKIAKGTVEAEKLEEEGNAI